MPIYEYQCEECEEEIEVIQKVSDDPIETCPSCQNTSLKKKASMSAFHLKGGGWYKDGYGNGKDSKNESKPTKEKTAKSTTKTKDTTKTKTESKPATSSTPKASKAS